MNIPYWLVKLHSLLRQSLQNILRDLNHGFVAAFQTVHPIRRAGGNDGSAFVALIGSEDGVALMFGAGPFFIPNGVSRCPFGGAGREDFEILRRTVF